MDSEKKPTNYTRKIARIILKSVLFLFLFIILVFLLILTPPVQRFLTGKVENYLHNKLQTRVEIGSISFGLSGNVNLENVYLEDKTKDTLLSGGMIKAHINFLKLFSNEVEIKDLELQNITAKIKRVLPDTTFNFDFITKAFMSDQTATPDTAQSPPMKLNISDLSLDNINLTYNDVVTGSDVFAHIGSLSATIDSLDPYVQHFDIPTLIVRNVDARVRQFKPIVKAEPASKDLADAAQPAAMKLSLGTIDLNKINIKYDNDVSALYTVFNIGQLKTNEKLLDLENYRIYLDDVALNNSKIAIRLGKKEAAKVVAKEAKQEVEAQKTAGWDFRIARIALDNNSFQFDNDNNPKMKYGLDYSHMLGDQITFHAEDFVMNTDTVALRITKGNLKEKSGFQLDELTGDIIYASKTTSLKDLYIKTPGTEIKRSLVLEYPSLDALMKMPDQTRIDVELVDSKVQVKDILTFAPQLRSNPALSNPNDVWYLNFIGQGTLNRLQVDQLKFDGLRNTHINASGTLAGLTDPKRAGGNFTIYRFHTTQSDIALFTGQRLSNAQINLPEEFDIAGTVRGNAGRINTSLSLSTAYGNATLRGQFSNLTNPAAMTYDGTLSTRSLRLGTIMRQPDQLGNLTGSFTFHGRSLDPKTINTRFDGTIASFGYNKYTYRNIRLNGTLNRTVFNIHADANDPNADFNLAVSGDYAGSPSFKINGMVDSVKTLPLGFTTQPIIFRGRIDGTVANIGADNMDADVLITKALLVSGTDRLPLDTVQLRSGTNADGNFIALRSDIINAGIQGQYRLSELGSIFQNTIQPYFTVASAKPVMPLQPYRFTFQADVVYTPILSSFVPGLTTMEPIHAEGSFASDSGMKAVLSTPYVLYNGTAINNLNVNAYTSDSGLVMLGNIDRIKSGSSLDVFHTRFTASAMNNNINFALGIDDQNSRNKYHLSGMLTQPATGSYVFRLNPDSLLLNYQTWTVSPNNQITISPTSLLASDFTLSQGNQQLSLNSLAASGDQPLQVAFKDFRLATITGFVKSDSLLIDGLMNGEVVLRNLMEQPVFTSNLTINDLSMKQDTLGNVNLQVSTTDNQRYLTNVTLSGRGNDLALTGSFAPQNGAVALDLNLDVRQLQLNTMEGALATAITNASGTVNGQVRIQGTTTKPQVQGDLNFNQASFALTALGSQFRIDNEKISVTQDGFRFDNFTIRDTLDRALTIDGTVLTANFINYDFDLDVNAENFEVLNSTKAQNKIYYGKLNISTDLHIAGTETRPVVDGSLSVNDGTNLFVVIPQAEPGVVQREGIVEFVDFDAPENDSLFANYDSLNVSNVLGMDIAVNIEVKKEAILNVIVDEANGDFLNVRGEAVLSAGIDPSGKITMVGNYSIEEGSYQISFNFIQRKFDIQKGSTITWTGEPTTAQLNVTAVYVANTAPLDLVAEQISEPSTTLRNRYLQKLPFEVHLNLTGEMLKPVIAFDILLPDNQNYGVSNDIVTTVQSRLDQLRQDEGEINKQVFSLLLLGRFVGENPFESSGGGFNAGTYARQSVSKLLTEQLNSLAAGLINGVDLNFDVASTEDYTTGSMRNRTDLNVSLSKRLLNDRLKITVGSNFQLEGSQPSNQRNNNIAGNIAVDYSLSRDGRYLLRFYRSNEYEGVVDGYIVETGVSFIISVDYNRFRQIFRQRRQRANRAAQAPRTDSTGTTQNTSGQ